MKSTITKPTQEPRLPPGGPIDEEQAKKEREALKKVKLRSFTATPPSVAAFGQSTLQWDVTVPSGDPLIDIAVYLDAEGVSPHGSKKVSPSFTRTFELKAAGEFATRLLGKAQVTVDLGACQVQGLAPVVFSAVTKPQIDALFRDNPDVKLKDGGSKVALGRFSVDISIPLEIEVPSWFNADMDISLKFRLHATDRVRASLDDVSVDVSWTLFEHLFSLGCTGIVQAALEKQAEV